MVRRTRTPARSRSRSPSPDRDEFGKRVSDRTRSPLRTPSRTLSTPHNHNQSSTPINTTVIPHNPLPTPHNNSTPTYYTEAQLEPYLQCMDAMLTTISELLSGKYEGKEASKTFRKPVLVREPVLKKGVQYRLWEKCRKLERVVVRLRLRM